MRRKLPVLMLALIILLQAFVPAVYGASENEAVSSSVYLCPFDATSEGAGKAETKALQTYYPPNSGFLKDQIKTTLSPGTKFDRYGYPAGYYASPVGTPAEMRALSPGTLGKPYTVYEVVKPLDTLSGQVMPWFGQPGLGTQYKFTQSFENILKQGIIREVAK